MENSVNAEIAENRKFLGWLLYDGHCPLCVRLATQWQSSLAGRNIGLLPLQTPWVRRQFALTDAELMKEMRLLRPDGSNSGGVDALIEIAQFYWWTWPLRQLVWIPAFYRLAGRAYRWIADRRHCHGGRCRLPTQALARAGVTRCGKTTVFFDLP